MPSFIETPRFPDEVAFWAVGGRGWKTTVVETYGGDEYRTSAWEQARGEWDVAEALRNTNPNATYALTILRNFHRLARGQRYGFRFKDFTDFQDEGAGVLGTTGLAVAATLSYQMYKNYAISPLSDQQIIQKPALYTITVYDNGTLVPQPSGCVVDYSTGIVAFVSQPTVGHALTWKGEFDVPVRFGSDLPRFGMDTSGAFWAATEIKLVEIRNPNGA